MERERERERLSSLHSSSVLSSMNLHTDGEEREKSHVPPYSVRLPSVLPSLSLPERTQQQIMNEERKLLRISLHQHEWEFCSGGHNLCCTLRFTKYSLINRNALILTKFYMEYFFRLSSRNNFLLSDISCLSKRQIKFCCQSFIFYTNLAKHYIFHGSSKKLRIASSINKQISNILHSFLFRCRMSMNDKMILSSDFTGYIKRFSGNWLS